MFLGTDESMEDDDKNDLMSQWFEMINHKNDLVRQESELIYRYHAHHYS